jgi:nitroimidazol reductase NimA-like FMN-containing flavoprotein (pyridoxamine 5'-phosphate oxidase superfamily)
MADDKLRALGEERVQDFLKLARVARLATSEHSGVPHNIPICFWFDEVPHFYFVIDEKPKRLTAAGSSGCTTLRRIHASHSSSTITRKNGPTLPTS